MYILFRRTAAHYGGFTVRFHFRTIFNNTTGDVAVSLIVASSEGLLDTETYNS